MLYCWRRCRTHRVTSLPNSTGTRVQRVYISVRDVPRIAFPCCNRVQHGIPRSTVRFMAATGRTANRKWVRAEQHGRIDSYDSACCFITTRELRREWSLMCGIGGKKASSFPFPLSFSLFHEYAIRLFGPERGNRRPRCFSGTMEQYLVARKWKYI